LAAQNVHTVKINQHAGERYDQARFDVACMRTHHPGHVRRSFV
jgi:hypothetical protein